MKIQLDTDSKTIIVEGTIVLKDLIDGLEKLFPDGEWKEYKLEQRVVNEWNINPIIPYTIPANPYTGSPWNNQPIITYC